jgi:hypothetical protein
MLIAQRLNLPVYGVNLPNLFVLTYRSASGQFYINVFNRGLIFTKKDIDQYIDQLNLKRWIRFTNPAPTRTSSVACAEPGAGFREKRRYERVREVEQILNTVRDEGDGLPLSDYTQR